jgi:TonB family protein
MTGSVRFDLGRLGPFTVMMLLLGSPGAYAACAQTSAPPVIPQGSTATQIEMASTQTKLKAYAESLRLYWRCLFSEYQQGIIGRDKVDTEARRKEVVRIYNEGVNELHGWGDCYNAELGNFKRTGGGKEAKPADCATYLEHAKTAPQEPPPAPAQKAVMESPPNALPTGTWKFGLSRGEQTMPCVLKAAANCNQVKLWVANGSQEPLECTASLQLEGQNNEGESSIQRPAVSRPHTNRAVLTSLVPVETAVYGQDVQCKVRQRPPALIIPEGCKFQLVRSVNLMDYYPPASRRLNEEGPVVVQFTLPKPEGPPVGIQVNESSLFERLDAAAIKAVGDMEMTTKCPGTTYRIVVDFKLD